MTEHQQSILNLGQFDSHFFYNTLYMKKHYVPASFSYTSVQKSQIPSNATTDKVHNWKNTVRYFLSSTLTDCRSQEHRDSEEVSI